MDTLKARLFLETRYDGGSDSEISVGTFRVPENRAEPEGRMLELGLVVLPATDPNPRPDPIFYLAGGPGQAAADMYSGFTRWALRKERDIVLVNQRGTGGSNALKCHRGSDDDIQGYLEPTFIPEAFRACLEELEKNFDLTQYSTPIAMDDLNEIRRALGYDRINLMGSSYGTRACLVYMRRYPETVRSAVLNGVAPIAFKNPLYHAWGAQQAMDRILQECMNDPECRQAFPGLEEEFQEVLDRLTAEPAEADVTHPVSEERVQVKITRELFAESLRSLMYSVRGSRFVPLFIHRAYQGSFSALAQRALDYNRSLYEGLALGMLLCVTCAEDLDRISWDEIAQETAGTFFGDFRVRGQKETCEFWPRSILPRDFGEPVQVDVPVLLLSGTNDPVTPPRWGEETAATLPNSRHIVAPGAHGIGGDCISGIIAAFLDTGSVENLDTDCVDDIRLPAFEIPARK